ncbi:hypothetical protein SSX86_024243 [Deinandra increscens subsp. villosa]|uniref:60S ribosomal protein L18a-like protein n=1 Tax=Deinandra increscens subsp. villosa TaxID=3103831 RepID=A0AAP0CHM2_9ASTR
MSEEPKDYNQQDQRQPPHHYGTFQGVNAYPPPVIGFPQPAPPPGASGGPSSQPLRPWLPGRSSLNVDYKLIHDQTVRLKEVDCSIVEFRYAIAEGRPVRERRLPCCCGIGVGWCLFISGFFLAAIPWYVGAFILLCARFDHREKPGYVACLIAAILGTIAVILGVTSDDWDWDWDWD